MHAGASFACIINPTQCNKRYAQLFVHVGDIVPPRQLIVFDKFNEETRQEYSYHEHSNIVRDVLRQSFSIHPPER